MIDPMDIIPRPRRIQRREGAFRLPATTRIVCDPPDPAAQQLAEHLGRRLDAAGRPAAVVAAADAAGGPLVRLAVRAADGWPAAEAYRLAVSPTEILIEGAAAGAFYGVQALADLVAAAGGAGELPCVEIVDEPAFRWRGLMLDCSRHFLSPAFLRQYVDVAARLRLNRLHLHLVDNEGWRVEIRAYPRLTEVGAFVETGEARGGFYTQAELRELVTYAAARHVTVVPEVEVPGHSLAAVRSYPELCCTRRPQRNEGHQKDLYCAGREGTFEFLEAVFGEVLEVFPSPYIHVGGDEAPKDRWRACPDCQGRIRQEGLAGEEALQGYVMRRIAKFLTARGRRPIAWEEILDGDPPREMIVHWWRDRTHGQAALREAVGRGHDVLASPNTYCYLNFPTTPDEHFRPERTSDLPKVYAARYRPADLLAEHRDRILGAEACCWTEYLSERTVGPRLFPRLLACAELMWSDPPDRDAAAFARRAEAAMHAAGWPPQA